MKMHCHSDKKKLSILCFGVALGVAKALYMALLAWMAWLMGQGVSAVHGLSQIMQGYGPSFLGGIAGALWGFSMGFIFGIVVAWIYNRCLCCCQCCCTHSTCATDDKKV